jgi:hypothetical protein
VPDDLVKRNLLVEVSTADKTRVAAHFAGEMHAKLGENYRQPRGTDSAGGKPLSKVYARLADGSVKFRRDGYPDLRGRSEDAPVSTQERQPVGRSAVPVIGDDRGAATREAAPPQQSGDGTGVGGVW